jgi:glutamate racemase
MTVILPGVRDALAATRTGRIGVIGTSATIRSRAYTNGLLARREDLRIFSRPCPLLVPLVEEGWTNRGVTREILREYLSPLRRHRIDTLVLGCTHYPLLKPAIRAVAGRAVHLVDSAESCARYVKDRLSCLELLCSGRRRAGHVRPYVTDETDRFAELADRFLKTRCEAPWKVDLAPV